MIEKRLIAYKFRVYPNKAQRDQFNKTFGCCRLLRNKMLEEINKTGKRKTEKEYKERFEFMKEVDSIALQQARIDLETAFKNYKASKEGKRKGKEVGEPKFKSKKDKQNYRTVVTNNNITINFTDKTIKLPKVKGTIKFRDKRIFEGEIKSVTVEKNKVNQHFCVILVEEDFEKEIHQVSSNSKTIGLDYDSKNLFTDNQGNIGNYPRFYRKYEEKLGNLQRQFSKTKKRGKNRNRLRLRIAKLNLKIRNSRNDFHQKLTTKLVREYDIIGVEDLNMVGIARSLNLAKSTLDNAWGYFRNMLECKCEWYGKHLVYANKRYASSKICSNCGYKNVELKLSDREWDCPICHTHHDRDMNAGQNLLNYALTELAVGTTVKSLEATDLIICSG